MQRAFASILVLFSLVIGPAACKRDKPKLAEKHHKTRQKRHETTEKNDTPVKSSFFAVDEIPLREALASGAIKEVKRGRGGRSLAFKITLADGTEGYFKPEQSFSAAHWYAEVAAYYLDRELGLGRVPPVIGRQIAWSLLKRAAGSDERLDELTIGEDGYLKGAFVWWIPEKLTPLELGFGWERWIRIDPWSPKRVSPMRRPAVYREAIELERDGQDPFEDLDIKIAKDPNFRERPKELSDLIVFDYLIRNVDRWGGDNTNVRTLGKGGPLLFFDNGAGFPRYAHQGGIMETRLHTVQRFRRETIDALKKFDIESFKKRLHQDPLKPVLTDYDLEGLEIRRKAILEYVSELEEKFGQEIYTWP
ncbi:MAG: hypothetical protein IPJ88_03850 [Myxococcales bacterium]|nr:MAG: hypothetical protein IPJ88_03850 [Myxococcales bacterium]